MSKLRHPSHRAFAFCAPLLVMMIVAAGCSPKATSVPGSDTAEVKPVDPATAEATESPAKPPGSSVKESEPVAASDPTPATDAAPTPDSSSQSAAAAAAAAAAAGEQRGELKIRFEYGGQPPEQAAINVDRDVTFCGQFSLPNETLVVHPENRGIQNVVVYVYTGRGGTALPKMPASSQTHTLANQRCRFEPHILILQQGDTLRVTNEDTVGHNTNLSFMNNHGENPTVPPGADKQFILTASEPAPIPVACNIHPWMRGYVIVADHPFAAKSDENGNLSIPDLPAGKTLMFRVFHEAGSIDEVTINGKPSQWRRGRFEVDVQPGVNTLGTVVIPAASLNAD